MVHGILVARIPYSEVDDLVQDVFLLAMRRLVSLKDDKAFPGWLSMIARNQAIDYLRRAPKTAELEEGMLVFIDNFDKHAILGDCDRHLVLNANQFFQTRKTFLQGGPQYLHCRRLDDSGAELVLAAARNNAAQAAEHVRLAKVVRDDGFLFVA